MKHQLILWLLLLGNIYPLLSQNARKPVASVHWNFDAGQSEWSPIDSTRYYYVGNNGSNNQNVYCFNEPSNSYYLCRTSDYYYNGDTSLTTFSQANQPNEPLQVSLCQIWREDAQNRILEYGDCIIPGGNNSGAQRQYYTYDSLGRKKRYTVSLWNPTFQRLSIYSLTDFYYDTLGYQVYAITQTYGTAFYVSNIQTISIDNSNHTTTEINIRKDTPQSSWDTINRIISIKDTVAGIITSIRQIEDGWNGTLRFASKDSTIENTITLTTEQYNIWWNDTISVWQPAYYSYREYDTNGNRTYQLSKGTAFAGAPLTPQSEFINNYDSLNRITYNLTKRYNDSLGTFFNNQESTTQYDLIAGDSIYNSTITTFWDYNTGIYDSKSKRERYYDSLGSILEYRNALFDSTVQLWVPDNKEYYYYDENLLIGTEETLNQSISFTLSPNPTPGIANIQFEAKGTMVASLTLHNVSGQNVFEQTFNISTGMQQLAINLTTLGIPSGLYILKLSSPEGTHTNKLVYQP